MTFLAPWLLAMAAAIGVPIFVHLARRRRTERIAFPAVRYLETAEREQRRKRDLLQRILLALRVAAVLAIALAAAQPLLTWFSGRPALALAIVLDNSMSTDRRVPAAAADRDGNGLVAGQPALRALIADAVALLDAQPAGSRLWLLTADGQVRTGTAAELKQAAEQVTAMAGRGALGEAVRRAQRLVGSARELSPAIAVLTDGDAASLDTATAASAVPTAALVRRVQRSGPVLAGEVNRFVHDVRIAPRRWIGQGTISFRVDGDSAAGDSIPWTVKLEDRIVARGIARRGSDVSTTVGTTTRGWVAGGVEVAPDALPLDDVHPFAVDVRPPTEVRVDPTAGPFVSAAVATLREARLVGDGSGTSRGSAIQIVRADQASVVPAVIIAPSAAGALPEANRALSRLGVPWQFGPPVGDSSVATFRDSVLRAGSGSGVSLYRRMKLVPVATSAARRTAIDTIATVNGDPWIVAGDGYLLIGSALDPVASSLVLSAGFVPWLGLRLSAGLDAAQPVWRASPLAAVAADFPCDSVRSPDGSALALPRDMTEHRRAPRALGVYLCTRGARSAALVVAPDPAESRGAALDDRTIRARLGSTRAQVVSTRSALRDAIATQPGGWSAAPWLLAIALLALLGESVIARRGVRASRAAAPRPAREALA